MMYLLLVLSLIACGGKEHKPKPTQSDKTGELAAMYELKLSEIKALQSPAGWIEMGHCDAALWTGKLGAAHGVTIDFAAAEYPAQPGRFNRRPPPFCEAGAGSATSWSRDMGMGLLAYSWKKAQLGLVERHAAYGKASFWKMGEPLGDGRVLYTPTMIGHLYQVIWALGGEDNAARAWPSVYPSGLDDFQAHLQMMDIWLRGEIAEKDRLSLALDISNAMLDRAKEHAAREPACPFYQFLYGTYTGDLGPAVELLLSYDYDCQYFRDSEPEAKAGEWIFAASMTLERLGAWK